MCSTTFYLLLSFSIGKFIALQNSTSMKLTPPYSSHLWNWSNHSRSYFCVIVDICILLSKLCLFPAPVLNILPTEKDLIREIGFIEEES